MLSFLVFALSIVGIQNIVKAAAPRTLIVPTQYSTIQQAINSANPQDTVFVQNGVYFESVVVNKSISLIGNNQETTVIDGSGGSSTVVYLAADNITVKGFTVRKSPAGYSAIGVEFNSTGNTITNNTFANNNIGVTLSFSDNNLVSNNLIAASDIAGVYLAFSSNNLISANTVSDNYIGIQISNSGSNIVSGNNISNNYLAGINLASAGNNILFHNNFNNSNQASSALANTWSHDGEGNYWSDYNGTDRRHGLYQNETGSDGIGDVPYFINSDNQDTRPLMGKVSNFTTIFKSETYQTSIISNSTVSNFRFEIGAETGNRIIRFDVAGLANSAGFSRVRIPVKLMNYPFIVLVSDEEVTPTLLDVSNETFGYVYFTYTQSVQSVAVISSKTLQLYDELFTMYADLQFALQSLNATYTALLDNYTQLQESYLEMNNSYLQHLQNYNMNLSNVQNLMYIFAATTAIFTVTTVYLSKRVHSRAKR
jgi:parallel beta-helix repeat protein